MRIYVLNDTSRQPHSGCISVMRSLYKMLEDHNIVGIQYCNSSEIEEHGWLSCDAIVCNGEGTIHHNRLIGDQLMNRLKDAQTSGKKTLLVNAVFQNNPPYFSDVLRSLDLFTVREILSKENAILSGGNPEVYLDISVDDPLKSIEIPNYMGKVIVGCAGATVKFAKEFGELKKHPILEDSKDVPFVYMDGYGIYSVVDRIFGAKCYVTGQHHGLYAALLAHTPFVLVSSNSHKIEGVLKGAGVNIPVCNSFEEIVYNIEHILDLKEEFDGIFKWFDNHPRLTKERINKVLC